MKSLKGTQTAENLMRAFAGESQARNRYAFYESVAEKEGYTQVAQIFKVTAKNEKIHAKEFYKFLIADFNGTEIVVDGSYPVDLYNTSTINLSGAAQAELNENSTIYPAFADIAQSEGFPEVAAKFRLIASIEGHHSERFKELFENLKAGTLFKKNEQVDWICNVCGYIHNADSPPEICPVCSHPKETYEILAEKY